MVSRDDGLMRACSHGWLRCCDGGVPRPDGVVRDGDHKYFSGCRLKLHDSFQVLCVNVGKYQGNRGNWLKFLLSLFKLSFIISYTAEGMVYHCRVSMTGD